MYLWSNVRHRRPVRKGRRRRLWKPIRSGPRKHYRLGTGAGSVLRLKRFSLGLTNQIPLCPIFSFSCLQQALRQIAFRQIFTVLGMTKPLPLGSRTMNSTVKAPSGPSPGKKRPRENSSSEAVSPESKQHLSHCSTSFDSLKRAIKT